MNHFAFNNRPEGLKTSVYGVTSTNAQQQIALSDTGAVIIQSASADPLTVSLTGTPTVIIDPTASLPVTGTIDIGNTPTVAIESTNTLTVAGTVNVGNTPTVAIESTNTLTVAGAVTVSNTPTVAIESTNTLTVAGTVNVGNTPTVAIESTNTLTVAGAVTVSNTVPVNITNTSIITNNSFFGTSQAATTITSTTGSPVLANQDISTIKLGTFFVYNTGASAATISLQIRPDATATYMDDPMVSPVQIAPGSNRAIPVSTFAFQAQLLCSVATGSTSLTTFFNAQK